MNKTLLLAILTIALMIGGCTITAKDNSSMDDPTNSSHTWDLTSPPTREQVKMKDGSPTVFYETDDPRKVTFKLPDNVNLTLPLTLLTFDSYGRESPVDNKDPASFDAKTDRVSLDETIKIYRSTLQQLDMDTGTVAEFQHAAEAVDGAEHPAERVTSKRVEKQYRYMYLQVLAQYEPDVQAGYVKLSATWGKGLPTSWREVVPKE